MPVEFTLQPRTYTKQMRKEFDHKRLNRVFVLWLYRSGQLDKYVREINLARVSRGLIPHGFDIHHIVPLSGGGTNRLSNLCLIEKSLHKFINKNCFDPVLKDIKEGQTVIVPVPDFGRIAFRGQYTQWINDVLNSKKQNNKIPLLQKKNKKRVAIVKKCGIMATNLLKGGIYATSKI